MKEKNIYFCLLLILRVFASIWSNISDCDETFNYWEPTSYLLYDKGFQTWEYSPEYSIRSYVYILPHYFIGQIGRLLALDILFGRRIIFYFIRIVLGIFSAWVESYFLGAIQDCYSIHTARSTLLFLLASPGMFTASVAYLPSSFSMYFVLLATTFWMDGKDLPSLVSVAAACIFAWPFAGLSAIMLALSMVSDFGVVWFVTRVFFVGMFFTGIVLWVDNIYFHKYTVAPLNIIIYNTHIFDDNGGQNLYGVESWNFFIKSLLLNFSIAFPMSLLSPVVCKFRTNLLFFPYIITLCIFSSMAHKEERFLFMIYPLICFCAGIVVSDDAKNWLSDLFVASRRVSVTLYVILGMSRICLLIAGYGAPLVIYNHFSIYYDKPNTNLCIGKEWYRFPSSLFTEHSQVHWLKSEFDGQLPVYFLPGGEGTWQNGGEFNDQNEEITSRYTPVTQCDYIVDFEIPNQVEPYYSESSEFRIVKEKLFLDASATKAPFRWIYIPFLWETDNYKFGRYLLLERNAINKPDDIGEEETEPKVGL